MTFTPTDGANYTTATATVTITVSQGDAGDHLAGAGGDHLRDGAQCDAVERDRAARWPGTFVYTPASGTVLNAGRADVVGDLHADRHRELHDGDGDGDDHGVEGDAGDHLADAGGDHLRHGAECDAAERDVPARCRARSSTRRRAGTVLNAGSAQTLSVTFTPTDGANYNDGDGDRDDHGVEGDAGDHLADAGGDHLRHGAQCDAAERDEPAGVAGTFVYTPASGTVLNAGVGQTLSVTFTPTDTAELHAATATVTIDGVEGDAGDHVAGAGGDHLRHGAECDAAERDEPACRGRSSTRRPSGTVLERRRAQTLSVTFTPTDTANYTTATATVDDHGDEGDADDHVADAGGDHLRDGAECDAAERDGRRGAGHVRLHAGGRHGAERGRGADVVGDLHADRRGELHDGDGDRDDHRVEGDAGDHLAGTGGDHLRHGAQSRRS